MALLAGCGGGGGSDPAPAPAVPAASNTAEGFWSGRTSSGLFADVLILEDGSTWGVYPTSKAAWRHTGHQQGRPGRFNATLTEYSFSDTLTPEFAFSGR